MENQEPLVKGGCGHSEREILESGMICGVCGLMLLLLCGIGMIAGILA